VDRTVQADTEPSDPGEDRQRLRCQLVGTICGSGPPEETKRSAKQISEVNPSCARLCRTPDHICSLRSSFRTLDNFECNRVPFVQGFVSLAYASARKPSFHRIRLIRASYVHIYGCHYVHLRQACAAASPAEETVSRAIGRIGGVARYVRGGN